MLQHGRTCARRRSTAPRTLPWHSADASRRRSHGVAGYRAGQLRGRIKWRNPSRDGASAHPAPKPTRRSLRSARHSPADVLRAAATARSACRRSRAWRSAHDAGPAPATGTCTGDRSFRMASRRRSAGRAAATPGPICPANAAQDIVRRLRTMPNCRAWRCGRLAAVRDGVPRAGCWRPCTIRT